VRTPSLSRLAPVIHSQAFRIVVIYLALFAVSASALVAFVYWNTARVFDQQTDETIGAEVTGLVEQYQRLGLAGLTDVIIRRSMRGGQGLYLLASRDRKALAGNLDGWPQVDSGSGGTIEFNYERRAAGANEIRRARGRVFRLPQGMFLLVARDVHERHRIETLFTTLLPWSVGLTILLGLVGGLIVSRRFLARLDAINRTSREIIAGDLSKRVPMSAAGDEFDDLAGHLNRMLDRIERLLRGMREVSDNVAHDLRSPLNRLRAQLENAQRSVRADPEAARDIEAAIAETERLMATFNALLLIAEAEAGSVRESMETFDLHEAVTGVGELYAPLAEEKGVRLTVEADVGVLIRGNRNLVSQAVANLVDNAIKYTPSGGTITVSLENGGNGPAVVVADSGPGIPARDRPRVTERFVRLESSRNSPGTGLGLSLVAAVARLHDADLELADNAPGLRAGLRFRRCVAAESETPRTLH
jgi:hypothetical protein